MQRRTHLKSLFGTSVLLQAKLLNYFLGSNKSNINQLYAFKQNKDHVHAVVSQRISWPGRIVWTGVGVLQLWPVGLRNSTADFSRSFLSFFLGWRRPNLLYYLYQATRQNVSHSGKNLYLRMSILIPPHPTEVRKNISLDFVILLGGLHASV